MNNSKTTGGAASTAPSLTPQRRDLAGLGLWPLRVAWLAMPVAVAYGLASTFEHLDDGPKLGIELWWWGAWFAGLIAVLVPNPVSLTIIRILAPTSILACLIAGIAGDHWPSVLWISLALSVLVTAIALLPTTGDPMVNGSAYGSERRMALRPPGFALLGPIPIAWLVAAAGLLTPPLALAAGAGVLSLVAVAVGAAAIWFAGRILHQLARRWIVFVPAGFVIHDPIHLVDASLLRRSSIAALGPALATPETQGDMRNDVARTDLSGGALGLALGVDLVEPAEIALRRFRRSAGHEAEVTKTSTLIFAPSLPGALLTEARVRGIKIGATAAASTAESSDS